MRSHPLMRRAALVPTGLVCLAVILCPPDVGGAQKAKDYRPKDATKGAPTVERETPATATVAPNECPACHAAVPPGDGQIVCQGCGKPLIVAPGGAGALASGLRLVPSVCVDTEGTGMEAFRMLVPAGWDFEGGVKWNLANPGLPVIVAFQLRNPGGSEVIEVFPGQNFSWSTSPMFQQMHPVGSVSLGAIVMPPMDAQQMLRDFLLPACRGRGVRIKSGEPLPQLAAHLASAEGDAPGTVQRDAAKVRIAYQGDAGPVEEELYGAVSVASLPTNSMFGQVDTIVWFANYIFSCRSAEGRLDAGADLFRTVVSSIRLNPTWKSACEQITVGLCQNQIRNIRQIGEFGRAYAQQGSDQRDSQLDDWYARQEIKDGIMDDVSRTIRGVDAFYDPHKEQTVELPGGYGHAWANNLGEYIVTESTDFNPNLGSNLHWEPMEPR
ncbi:MAG: hypothetical protein FJX74_09230 [Armatimonadetes bacterium]|nr:hypothetical protein [Armatimonadota bacterium]